MHDQPLSKLEFHEWKQDSRTKQVIEKMRQKRQEWVDHLTSGKTLCGHGPTEQETARAVGVITGIDLFLEADWEEQDGAAQA